MASVVFSSYLHDSIAGEIDLLSNDIKCALMNSSYTPVISDTVFDDTYEVVGTGYTPGGKSMTGKMALEEVLRSSALTWSNCTIRDIKWAVLYNSSNSNRLIAAFEFDTVRRTRSGSIQISWAASGVIRHRSGM